MLLLVGCGGQESTVSASSPSAGQVAPISAAPKVSFYAASRFAEQATFGATPALVAELQAKGFEKWIDEQLALPASDINLDRWVDWTVSGSDLSAFSRFEGEALRTFLTAPDQLRWRMTWSLSQFIVVSEQKLDPAGTAVWVNHLNRMALGTYGELLRGVTLSAPMGFYLDNAQNRPKGDDCPHCVPNENYARELMQLFSLGVWALNADGSPKRDARGRLIETYSQRDVEELARVLTGWRYDEVRVPDTPRNWGNWAKPMQPSRYAPDRDSGRKVVLGRVFPAGQTIHKDLDDLVDLLMGHPNIGPFVAQRLIQNFVKSEPSAAYLQRVAAVFRDNGRGQAGDLKATLKAVLLDPEARRGDNPAQAAADDGKLREPLLHRTALLRGLGCRMSPIAHWNSLPSGVSTQKPFSPMSVFGWYAATDRAPGSNLLAPEQKLLTPRTFRDRLMTLDGLAYTQGSPPYTYTGALETAGCRLDDLYAAVDRSAAEVVTLVGQRYLRGQVPHELVPEVDRLLKAWRATGHMNDPRRQAIRLLEYLLASDGFGAMR